MKGFTLIELCIVIIISGLLLTGFVELLQRSQANKDATDITKKFELIRLSLNNFTYDDPDIVDDPIRFPCPAPLNLKPGDKGYGIEFCPWEDSPTDKGDIIHGVKKLKFMRSGSQVGGISVVESIGDSSLENLNKTHVLSSGERRLVLIGALPAISLGIPQHNMTDPYGNVFMYAVTLDLTKEDALLRRPAVSGAIKIVDSFDEDITNSARFFIYSSGQDGAGGYFNNGKPNSTKCRDTIKGDALNCQWKQNNFAIFRANNGLSHGKNDNYYDDWTAFHMFSQKDVSGWWQSIGDGGRNIIAKNEGALILGQTVDNDKESEEEDEQEEDEDKILNTRDKLIVAGDIRTNRVVFAEEPEIEDEDLLEKIENGEIIDPDDCDEEMKGAVRYENGRLQFCIDKVWKALVLGGFNCPSGKVLAGIGQKGAPRCIVPPMPKGGP